MRIAITLPTVDLELREGSIVVTGHRSGRQFEMTPMNLEAALRLWLGLEGMEINLKENDDDKS